MRNDYYGSHKYDSPFTAFLDQNDTYSAETGDVDSPTGWVGLVGRNIVTHDTQGFVTRYRFTTITHAAQAFADLDTEYAENGLTWED
jgi:hypothetical protein